MQGFSSFADFMGSVAGVDPYPYQERLACEGLPVLLQVPTGAGKTEAAVLPWWYRRRHSDQGVRAETPRRLVVVQPQRSLVTQTVARIRAWNGKLAVSDRVPVHVLMGGEAADDRDWKMRPEADATIFVGTQDMVLSRLLNRGFGERRPLWPVSFGLLNSDCQFVFDEVQLMGPGLATSLQLQGFREAWGTAAPTHSMWMSATMDQSRLLVPDFDPGPAVAGLRDSDRAHPALSARLSAVKRVERGVTDADNKTYAREVAGLVRSRHRAGTRTIVMLNTVDRAQSVFDEIVKFHPGAVLTHSRYRPGDRDSALAHALADPGEEGSIVVSTQVLEAGVDITCRLLVTEVAPWSSMVQRSGRCNRGGEDLDAEIVWCIPPGKATRPYTAEDLSASAETLESLQGQVVTAEQMQTMPVAESRPLWSVIRRRDFLDLFDTAPDLAGEDIDISRWIREPDVASAAVAWRHISDKEPADPQWMPRAEELCPVPVSELRKTLEATGTTGVVFDEIAGAWRAATRFDARPGAVVVLDPSAGRYTPRRGWDVKKSKARVEPVAVSDSRERASGFADDERSVYCGRWVSLAEHLDDVERETAVLWDAMSSTVTLPAPMRQATIRAGAYHDLGKSFRLFQEAVEKLGPPPVPDTLWAKSDSTQRLRYARPFRHELVTALMLTHADCRLLDDVDEPDLVMYLAAAHHGKARVTVRARASDAPGNIMGVASGDETPALVLANKARIPAMRHDLTLFSLGDGHHGESWWTRVLRLRDREDVGPLRLGFMEAIVRIADWRVSASYETLTAATETS